MKISDAPMIGSTIGNRFIGLKIIISVSAFFSRYFRFIENDILVINSCYFSLKKDGIIMDGAQIRLIVIL